LYLKTTVNQ